jgi:hypothetical protein
MVGDLDVGPERWKVKGNAPPAPTYVSYDPGRAAGKLYPFTRESLEKSKYSP